MTQTLVAPAPAPPPPPLEGRRARRERIMAANSAWFAVVAAVLAGIAPVLLIAATPTRPHASGVWLWAWALTVVVGLRYAWLIADGSRRLFEQIVWLFTYVFLGLAPLVQIRTGTYPDTTPFMDERLHGPAMAIVLGGLLAFSAGIAIAGRGSRRHLVTDAPGEVSWVSTHRVMGLTAVSLGVTAWYALQVGDALFASRAERSTIENALWANSSLGVVIRAAATLPLMVSFAGLLQLRRQRRSVGGAGPSILPWFVLLVLVVVVNPISSPRYVVGTALLGALAALGAAETRNRMRIFAASLAAALVLVFPYTAVARFEDQGASSRGGPVDVLASGDFDAFDQINNTVAYVRAEGHTGGQQLAGAALFWVPRAVWPGKAEDTGVVIAEFRDYRMPNLSAPLWAELFVDGGWPLLLFGMTGLGWLVRRMDERAIERGPSFGGAGVLPAILPFYMVILLRGSLLQAMAGLSVLVTCGLVARGRPGDRSVDPTRVRRPRGAHAK